MNILMRPEAPFIILGGIWTIIIIISTIVQPYRKSSKEQSKQSAQSSSFVQGEK